MHISPEHDIFNLNERKNTDFEWIKDWFSFCIAIEPRQLDDQAFQQKKAAGSLIEEVDGVVVCRYPQDMGDQQSIYAIITALHDQMKNHNHVQQINDKLRSQIILAQKVKYFLDDIDTQKLSETQQKIYDPLYQAIADTASLIPDQITSLSPVDEKEVLTHLLGNERFYDIATERVENTDDGHLTQGYKMRKLTQVLNIMSRVHTSSRSIARSAAECTYDLFVEGSHLLDMVDSSLPDSIFYVGEDKLFDEATVSDNNMLGHLVDWFGMENVFGRNLTKKNKKIQDEIIQGYIQNRSSATTREKDNMIIDFMKKINQSYLHRDETYGSPRQALERREIQCVSKAHLGEMLRQIEGVKCSVISMDEHVTSLIYYDQRWHYMDIGYEILYELSDEEYCCILHQTLPRGVIDTYKTKDIEFYETLLQDPIGSIVGGASWSMYLNMGIAYRDKQEYDKAIQAYQKAIEVGGEKAYLNVGVAYSKKQEYDKAIQAYQKAIETGQTQAYFNIGNVYHEKQEYDKAIQVYQKFIELHNNQDQRKKYVLRAQQMIEKISTTTQQNQDI